MKSFKRLLCLPACCLALLVPAGCNKNVYSVYTNIPADSFNISDNNYKTDVIIGGYSSADAEYEDADTSAYSTKQETYFAMMADAVLVVSADFSAEGAEENFNSFSKAVRAKLNEIDRAISSSIMYSDIYKFNNAEAGATLEIQQITYEVLSEAKYVYELTEGYYNPALYYNIHAYGFGGSADFPQTVDELPKDEVIEKYTSLASHFGEMVVEQAEAEGKYYVTKPQATVEVNGEALSMKLDLGGIGKGYAVDCVDRLFDEYGYNYGYFSFGSSSMLIKSNVKEGFYELGLAGPRSPARDPYIRMKIRNEKLSSSGDNEQRYFIDGVRYCHIISPKTGKPVQTGIMTATVIGGKASYDDALTTAIMAMEKDYAIKFIEEKLGDRKVVFACE